MSQCIDILDYMKRQLFNPSMPRISTWIAIEEYGCTVICQRIPDLRKKLRKEPLIINDVEYFIYDELVTRDGKSFSEYWLEPIKQEIPEHTPEPSSKVTNPDGFVHTCKSCGWTGNKNKENVNGLSGVYGCPQCGHYLFTENYKQPIKEHIPPSNEKGEFILEFTG